MSRMFFNCFLSREDIIYIGGIYNTYEVAPVISSSVLSHSNKKADDKDSNNNNDKGSNKKQKS